MEDEFFEAWESLPEDVKEALKKAIEESTAADVDQFISEIFVGDCPECGSSNTSDCEEIPEIEDVTVGLCMNCGYLWCTECERHLDKGIVCVHWEICEKCDVEKNEFDDCGITTWECEKIMGNIDLNDNSFIESKCSWCNKTIDADSEVFSLGAKARKGIDISGYEGKTFPLTLIHSNKTVPAILTKSDSEAKKEGNDLLFMLCSPACSESLKVALKKEMIILN